jgi:hypothetical protein
MLRGAARECPLSIHSSDSDIVEDVGMALRNETSDIVSCILTFRIFEKFDRKKARKDIR